MRQYFRCPPRRRRAGDDRQAALAVGGGRWQGGAVRGGSAEMWQS